MKKLLIGCGALILLIVVTVTIGITSMSGSYSVERELEMQATPEAAYETIAKLSTWPEWSAWNKNMDPEATWEFSGSESGDGAVWTWQGTTLGHGELTLRDCQAPTSISYNLAMEGGEFNSVGVFTITPTAEGIKVHWLNEGELTGIWKLMVPWLDDMMGEMYESGLIGLKTRLEAEG